MAEAPKPKTKSQEVAAEIAALLRARNSLIWISTREEARVERYLAEAAGSAGYVPCWWDAAAGLTDINGKPWQGRKQAKGIDEVLELVEGAAESGDRRVWILRDLPGWLQGALGLTIVRQVRNLARKLPSTPRDNAQAMVVITPSGEIPPELAGHAKVIEWPMPDRAEIAAILDAAIEALPEEMRETAAANGTRDAAIDAAVGLTGEEAAACYAQSLVQLRRIDPVAVAKEKRRVIARERVLEWYDVLPGGMDAVGGLENLKAWLLQRRLAYTTAARTYGVPAPKGVMVIGVSGCGKSLLAKAAATNWGVPLLRVDLGALKSKFVGESEANLRKAFNVISTIGRCVVWFDEIEKSLAGATQGAADGGVSSDALGAILTWMQERSGQAFVIATANDVTSLPPELLRKGRFDEIWWVDLPNPGERIAVLIAALKAHGRDAQNIIVQGTADKIVDACDGFTGSEIAALVPDALYSAFSDGEREITVHDLLAAAKTVVPLSRTAAEKIVKMREWSQGRARPASTSYTEAVKEKRRELDI